MLVVCLCAQWCGVCGEYRQRFEQVQARFSKAKFLWLDVEDEAELLEPLDVANFPTLLLVVGTEARFFGPLAPQAEILERLLRSHTADASAVALPDPAATALAGRILASGLV
jgi:hypothetical protein